MAKYLDWFLRAEFDDEGQAPRFDGGSAQTPDIWIAGLEPLAKPAILATPEYMARSSTVNVVIGRTNYIYVRAVNGAQTAGSGKIFLYAMTAAYAQDPERWELIATADTARNYATIKGEPGLGAVGDVPFEFTPREVGVSGHYCLIARIETASHPNPLPGAFDSWSDFVKWLFQIPANTLRNVVTIPSGGGGLWHDSIGLPNFDAKPRECLLTATTQRVPVGSEVRMVCAKDGPVPPVRFHKHVAVFANDRFATSTVLPSNFSGRLDVTVSLPSGQTWQPDASVTFEKFIVISEEEVKALGPWLVPGAVTGTAPRLLLKVGECVLEVKDA